MIPLIATCGNPMLAHSVAYIGAQVFVKTCEKMYVAFIQKEKPWLNCVSVGPKYYEDLKNIK